MNKKNNTKVKLHLQNKVEGITRTLTFDGFGDRNNVIFDVLELTPAGNQTVRTLDIF